MENVRRIYVEKKNGFDVEAKGVLAVLKENLSLKGLKDVRIINRYDVSGVSDEEYQKARNLIFSEPPVDNAYDEEIEISEGKVFAVEFLPGQFDQRAASAEECISILTEKERPTVRSAKVYVLIGDISDEETEAVKNYVINPVEAREASLEKPTSLVMETVVPDDVAKWTRAKWKNFFQRWALQWIWTTLHSVRSILRIRKSVILQLQNFV